MSTLTATETLTGHYNLDPAHSRLGFVARHAMVTKVRGAFKEVDGKGYFDASDPSQSWLEVTIQAASIDTGNESRDGHLRTNDFFDPENYPEIRFRSTNVEQLDESSYRVTGDLSIKDTTKPITVDLELTGPAVDPWGNTRIGLEGSVVVNRRDWGINWNAALDAGGVLVSEKVTLEFDVAAVRQAAAAQAA
jgi:polyisoprenoid-binding protein YceI